MHNFSVDIEDAGLECLLIGLKHPAFTENKLLRALYMVLSLEWTCRQTNETSPTVAIPPLHEFSDEELKETAGLFYGFSNSIGEQYEKTLMLCVSLLDVLVEELQLRVCGKTVMH